MGSYLVVFFTAAAAVVFATPLFMRLAHRVGALDNTQDPAMPRVGGWGIAFGITASLLLVGVIFSPTGSTLASERAPFSAIAFGGLAILLLGSIDDISRNSSPS